MKNPSPLKWIGGKSRLLDTIIPLIPKNINTYYEPFLGGGSVLLGLKPQRAIVSDTNEELINFFNVVKNNKNEMIEILNSFQVNEETFYKIRSWDRDPGLINCSNEARAARLLFLNKTCFNGLYRVNKQGFNNAPFGKYKKMNFQIDKINELSMYLNTNDIKFECKSFTDATKSTTVNDFVYFDPPYIPISASENFTAYTVDGFGDKEQLELVEECKRLDAIGVKFLASNSYSARAFEIYKKFDIQTVNVNRLVGGKDSKRKVIQEILIKNY